MKRKRPTRDEVFDARTPKGGWKRATLETWGVPWPPPKGWIADLCGPERDKPEAMPSLPKNAPVADRAKQAINYAHREMMIGTLKRARKQILQAERLAREAELDADYQGAIRGLKTRIERKLAEASQH